MGGRHERRRRAGPVSTRWNGSDLRNSKILLTNNKIVQGPEIADHALAMLLMLSRNLYILYRNDQQQTWDPGSFHGIELNGKTAVVLAWAESGHKSQCARTHSE